MADHRGYDARGVRSPHAKSGPVWCDVCQCKHPKADMIPTKYKGKTICKSQWNRVYSGKTILGGLPIPEDIDAGPKENHIETDL